MGASGASAVRGDGEVEVDGTDAAGSEVGFSVAFNASETVRDIATASVTGSDLRTVLGPLDGWLKAER